ncbi:MAG: AAA family ATPase [Candidatus Odinarchaeia archaeon]
MKLTSAHITNFKCIEDSEKYGINQVTCFVGKNEAGKSTLLQALYKLNPSVESDRQFDPVIEYPRRLWSSYKEKHKQKPDTVDSHVVDF